MHKPYRNLLDSKLSRWQAAVVVAFVLSCSVSSVAIWRYWSERNRARTTIDVVPQGEAQIHNQRSELPTVAAEEPRHPPLGVVRANLTDDDDPLSEGWDGEAFNLAASKQLKRLASLLAGETDVTETEVGSIVATNFSCTHVRPRNLIEAFQDSGVVVLRPPEELRISVENPERLDHAAGLVSALNEMRAPLRDTKDRRAYLKIIHVEFSGDEIRSTIRVENCGFHQRGAVQQTARWLCVWHWKSPKHAPSLRAIEVDQYEEVLANGEERTLFVDETEGVLGHAQSYRHQLILGSNDWLAHIDRSLTLQTFGHQGIALGDANGDGLEDVYVCQIAGLPNRLYIQERDGTLTDVSSDSGVDWLEPTYSALFLDLDNDGDQDLALAIDSDVMIMSNNGLGKFTRRLVLPLSHPCYTLAAADYDGDADLDIYSCVYYSGHSKAGELAHPLPFNDATNGGRNMLWRNEGTRNDAWRFADVTDDVGLDANNNRWSFAASWEDYDNDGDMDLYVANDFGRNNLYRNEGGRFSDQADLAGVEDSSFGMSVAWGDYNRDGLMDLYVSNMFSAAGNRVTYQRQFKNSDEEEVRSTYRYLARGNSLFENSGDGTFRDVSRRSGTMMARWAWGSSFADVNNDGWEDLLVANGWLTNNVPDDL